MSTQGAGRSDRDRADAFHSRGRTLAPLGSLPIDLGELPGDSLKADPEPGAARHGLPQALGPPSPPCSGQWGDQRL